MSAIAALLLAAVTASAQEIRISTVEEAPRTARDLSIRGDSGALTVEFTDASGARRSVRAEEVVEIAMGAGRTAVARPGAEDIEIRLTTGDLLVGKAGPRAADRIQVLSPVFANPSVPIEHVRSILFPANRAFLPRQLPEKVDLDLVLRKSGDRAEGTLLVVSGTGVEYRSARFNREVTAPLADVVGIWLTEIKPPPREPASLFSIVFTKDGSCLRGEIQSVEKGILTFRDLFGGVHRIATSHLSGISMKNGRVIYLSDLDPKEVSEEANYIRGPRKSPGDLEYPFRKDRSARGTPIVLGGVEHRKGLGVRAHSELTYALDGAFRRFQTTVGIDAVAASLGLGAVAAEVRIDGKKVREAVFRAADAPQEWDLDVSGARELKLVVTWAGSGQSDFADWGSARLVR